MFKPLATTLLLTATSAQAQPNSMEIVATLLRPAATLQTTGYTDPASSYGATVGFMTRILHELGTLAPRNEDNYTFTASCQPEDQPDEWRCQVRLNIRWGGGAESGYSAQFMLAPAPGADCALDRLGGQSDFSPCAWHIPDNQVRLIFAG